MTKNALLARLSKKAIVLTGLVTQQCHGLRAVIFARKLEESLL